MTRMSSRCTRPTDEETPLLRHAHDQEHDKNTANPVQQETPLHWAQFSLLLFLQLAEPLTSQVIYPFVPQLIREIGVTNGDDTKVGYYVGLMQSIFFAAQALTVLQWSRASDRIGRKPVILVGLFGLSLSMYFFGLARTFWGLVISRSLSGALNGNIGVIKSMMGEMTDSTNIARAFAYQPIAWSSGATIGPLIGGALAHPAERFPNLFGNSDFLKKYPYFLPCAIPATFSILAWVVTYLFLEETNPTGFSMRSLFQRLIPRDRSSSNSLKLDPGTELTPPPPAPPLRSLLTRPVLLSTATYALLSLLDITYRALQPVIYSTPRKYGGLGLSPSAIGTALAILGPANGVFQVCFFSRMVKWWGAKKVYLLGIASAIPIFALFPLMSAVVHMEDSQHVTVLADTSSPVGLGAGEEHLLSALLIILLVLQLGLNLLLFMCYGCVFMFITEAATIRSASQISSSNVPSNDTRIGCASSSSTSCSRSTSISSSSTTHLSSKHNKKNMTRRASKNRSKVGGDGDGSGSSSTLGAVNGLTQCTVSIMRCIGPYASSSLYSAGLSWKYGRSSGGGSVNPSPGPSPDLGVGQQLLVDASSRIALLSDGGSGAWWRSMAGSLVFWVMIALAGVTLLVGASLPDGGWESEARALSSPSSSKEEEEEEEDEN